MKTMINRDSKYYNLLKFRWIFYLLISFFFVNRFIALQQSKAQHQKAFFEYYSDEVSSEFVPPSWMSRLPQILHTFCEGYGFYEIKYEIKSIDLDFFQELSNFSNIDSFELEVYDLIVPKEVFTLLKNIKFTRLTLSLNGIAKGGIKELAKIQALESIKLMVEYIHLEELKYLSKIVTLTELDIDIRRGPAGSSGPAPITGFLFNEISYLPRLEKLRVLNINAPLRSLIPYLDRFPNLMKLNISRFASDNDRWAINSDEQIDTFLKNKNLNIDTLQIGTGVTSRGLKKLTHVKGLTHLIIPLHNDLHSIQWSEFSKLEYLELPLCYDVKKILKKIKPSTISQLFCSDIEIDMETLELLLDKNISKIDGFRICISDEVRKSLTSKIDTYGLLRNKFKNDNSINDDFYRLINNQKRAYSTILTPEDILLIEDKSIYHLDLCFNTLTKEHIEELNNFPNLESLNLEVYTGLENLNSLKRLSQIEDLQLTIYTLPKTPLKVKNLSSLYIHTECSGQLDKLLDSAGLKTLESFSINALNVRSTFKINSIRVCAKLETLDISGNISMSEVAKFPKLTDFTSNTGNIAILESLANSKDLESIYLVFLLDASSGSIKALLPIAEKIDYLDLSIAQINEQAFELILKFKNIYNIKFPWYEQIVSFETFKKILQLPKIETISITNQYFSKKQLNSLSKKELKLISEDYY